MSWLKEILENKKYRGKNQATQAQTTHTINKAVTLATISTIFCVKKTLYSPSKKSVLIDIKS